MDYIRELRALTGPRPLLLVGASIAVFDASRRVLLMRRADNGLWSLPGGFLEPGERPEEGARRELLEETGLDAAALSLFDVFGGPELFRIYPNGDQVHAVDIVYTTTEPAGELRPVDGEATALCYFALDELPADLFVPEIPVLQALKLHLNPEAPAGESGPAE